MKKSIKKKLLILAMVYIAVDCKTIEIEPDHRTGRAIGDACVINALAVPGGAAQVDTCPNSAVDEICMPGATQMSGSCHCDQLRMFVHNGMFGVNAACSPSFGGACMITTDAMPAGPLTPAVAQVDNCAPTLTCDVMATTCGCPTNGFERFPLEGLGTPALLTDMCVPGHGAPCDRTAAMGQPNSCMIDNMMCHNSGTCQCMTGYQPMANAQGLTRCIPSIGTTCQAANANGQADTCTAPGAGGPQAQMCDPVTLVCTCMPNFISDEGTPPVCRPAAGFGGELGGVCDPADPNSCANPARSECAGDPAPMAAAGTMTCRCQAGFTADEQGRCQISIAQGCVPPVGMDEDPCGLSDSSCVNTAAVGAPAVNECRCNAGFELLPATGQCVRIIGTACANNADCQAPNQVCADNMQCGCDIGFVDDNEMEAGGTCRRRVGSECVGGANDNCDQLTSTCVDAACACNDGFQDQRGLCVRSIGQMCNIIAAVPPNIPEDHNCDLDNSFCNNAGALFAAPQCACDAGFEVVGGLCGMPLGSPCTINAPATANAPQMDSCVLPDSECRDDGNGLQCLCSFRFTEQGGLCVRDLGAPCNDNSPCEKVNSICMDTNGDGQDECACAPEFRDSNGLAFGGICENSVGAPCTIGNPNDDCPLPNQRCNNDLIPSTCACQDGFGGDHCSGPDFNFCANRPNCMVGEGDCDNDAECDGDLRCGINNCGADRPLADCCFDVNNEQVCDQNNPNMWACCQVRCDENGQNCDGTCQDGQGDCDTDDECAGALVCGRNNCGMDFNVAPHFPHDNADCCTSNKFFYNVNNFLDGMGYDGRKEDFRNEEEPKN